MPYLRAWENGFYCRRIPGFLGSLAIMIFAAGCSQKMADQPRYDTYEASSFFPDNLSARPIPAGTIPRDSPEPPELLDVTAETFPFLITMEVLTRGQQRYDIYCTPCHGYTGYGDGIVAVRGFRAQPVSFHTEALRAAAPGRIFSVITSGSGAMSPYAGQIEVRDRWAITAYIRALQSSQWTTVEDIGPDELQKLGKQ